MRPKSHHNTQELLRHLAEARSDHGLTQAELGAQAGLPQSHLSNIERGKINIRVSSLLELARLLDFEVMLVPRKLVPAVRHLVAPDSLEHNSAPGTAFMYRLPNK
jgi:HTH-type transcriptional regulator/antitoxin HipB